MPCYDPRDRECRTEYVDKTHNGLTGAQLEALLCGVLNADREAVTKSKLVWDVLDFKEIGITRVQAETWWKRHKYEDGKRLRREEHAREIERRRKEGLKKLTYEERVALGLVKKGGV